jgi:hypothetical protein
MLIVPAIPFIYNMPVTTITTCSPDPDILNPNTKIMFNALLAKWTFMECKEVTYYG